MKCKLEIEMPENITVGQLYGILKDLDYKYSLDTEKAFDFNGVNLGFPKGTPIHIIRVMLLALPRNYTCHMPWSFERKIDMVYDDVEESQDVSEVSESADK